MNFAKKIFCKFWNFVSVGASTLINFLIILCYICILGVVGQQLISRVRKKCPTSSEASLKKQFSHCFSQLDSFSGASLATGLALTWTPNKNKKPSRVGIIRKLAILVKICKKEMKNFVEWANAMSDFWIFNFQNIISWILYIIIREKITDFLVYMYYLYILVRRSG